MAQYPKNPYGFGALTEGKEVAAKLKDNIVGKTGTDSLSN
jgi:hypothetical protein